MESKLFAWTSEKRDGGFCANGPMIRRKAIRLMPNNSRFLASDDWLQRFFETKTCNTAC